MLGLGGSLALVATAASVQTIVEIVTGPAPLNLPIVAWGDSLTRSAGASADAARYPAVAADLFDPPRDVLNKGIGGQISTQIAARQGGVSLLVSVEGDTIPAAYRWTWDWSETVDGWYGRELSGEPQSALSVADGKLRIENLPGASQGAAQFRLGFGADWLPIGYRWQLSLDLAGTVSGIEVGLMDASPSSMGGTWVGNGTPDRAQGSITPGVGQTASTVLANENARVLAFYLANRTGYAEISNAAMTAIKPVAVTDKSVNVLYNSGAYNGTISGTIAGAHGVMTTDAEGNWTFTRDDEGPDVACPPNTPFVPDDADALRARTAWIWAGRNNSGDPETIRADIAAMVAHLGHSRYLVGAVLNAGTETAGTSAHTTITALNADLATLYGNRYVDLRQALIDAGDPETDATDITNDVVPASLRSDNVHLNDAGYAIVAQAMQAATTAQGW